MRHPAKYTACLIPVLTERLKGCERVIDPFAGTGKIHLAHDDAVGVELEPEWAEMHPKNLVGNALNLPFAAATFDGAATSPVYGNRMSDSHTPSPSDTSWRNTYTHVMGHKLHPDNSGTLQWGEKYRQFHDKAWRELQRVLMPDATFVLNIKDHVRKGERQLVPEWHHICLVNLGFSLVAFDKVDVSGNGFGANGKVRVNEEWVLVYRNDDNKAHREGQVDGFC